MDASSAFADLVNNLGFDGVLPAQESGYHNARGAHDDLDIIGVASAHRASVLEMLLDCKFREERPGETPA